jgi:hypothetical protein
VIVAAAALRMSGAPLGDREPARGTAATATLETASHVTPEF